MPRKAASRSACSIARGYTAPRRLERAAVSRPSHDNRIGWGKLERTYRTFQSEGEADMAEEITKQEAVRRALKAMGRAATPSQMQPYIKENFGIEMSTDHISTSKGIILHPKKKGGKGAKRPAAQGAAATEGEAKEGGRPEGGGAAAQAGTRPQRK